MASIVVNIMILFTFIFAGSKLGDISDIDNYGRNDTNCDNFIIMRGQSNVNKFTFSYSSGVGQYSNNIHYRAVNDKIEITIPVRDFQTNHTLMYHDFLTILKEEHYPFIIIEFSEEEIGSDTDLYKALYHNVLITIAGITKEYLIECIQQKCGELDWLQGSQRIKFSDFGLDPPEKFNGLVKVKDELTVSFGFIVNFTGVNSLSTTR